MSTILIVDDDAPFRAVLRDILEPLGHRVVEAGDGEEAIERLGRMRVDLVISDQRMRRLDGLALLRRIRMLPSPPPVVLLTAYGTIPDAVDAVREVRRRRGGLDRGDRDVVQRLSDGLRRHRSNRRPRPLLMPTIEW